MRPTAFKEAQQVLGALIVANLDDTVGWLAEQLDPDGSALIVAPMADGLWTVNISTHDGADRARIEPNLTVRDLMDLVATETEPVEVDFLTEDRLPPGRRASAPVAV